MTARRLGARPAVLAAAGALAVAIGYQWQAASSLPGSSVLGVFAYSGFEPSERGYRFTHAHSEIRFRDAAAGPMRVELELVAWRPRDLGPPQVTVRALGKSVAVAPMPGRQTIGVEGRASGWWRTDVVVAIDSDTFVQSGDDARTVGVRVYGARLVPAVQGVALRRPPLEPLVLGGLVAILVWQLSLRLGATASRSLGLALAACATSACAWGVARPWAVLLGRPLALGLLAFLVALRVSPRPARALAGALGHSLEAVREGLRIVRSPVTAVLVALAALGLLAAHLSRPRLRLAMESARVVAAAEGFGPVETADGVGFREARPGAELDLRGFGGGAPWTIQVTSALEDGRQQVVVAEASGATLALPLGSAWLTGSLGSSPPAGWDAGLRLRFPGVQGGKLRVRTVDVDRGRSWPALRVLAAQLAAPLLMMLSFAIAGVGLSGALVGGLGVLCVVLASILFDPITAVTFSANLCGIVACGVPLCALGAGGRRVLEAHGHAVDSLPPVALAAACAGFVAWFAATAFPLYAGGHFFWHSGAAEELWRGHFLQYYLPEGESIMARQVQWGNIVVPHPFLYHLTVAPLAALPRGWFHWTEKGALALMLASLVVLASLLAGTIGGRRAAARAAVVAAAFVTSYQLLELGHLVAVFGTFVSSWALGFAVLAFSNLSERIPNAVLALLLTAALLSYTPCVLFTAAVVAAAVPLLYWQGQRSAAAALARAGCIAAVLAFLLFYANWTLPFLTQSLPALASSHVERESFSLVHRLGLQPQKLVYSYGSILIPIGGLVGLWLYRGRDGRLILTTWAALLVAVCGLDAFFNFLRKHHFFVIVPLEVGCGLVLARLEESGRAGRILAWGLLAGAIGLGARAALDAALALP